MKVLHVSAADGGGGAFSVATRLHEQLLRDGVASSMLVQRRAAATPAVRAVMGRAANAFHRVNGLADRLPLLGYPRRDQTALFSNAWMLTGARRAANDAKPDVIHLHWIAGGMIPAGDLAHLRPPLVWTLHDMWPLTGGCHYDRGCGRWEAACGRCPLLGSNRTPDLSSANLSRKIKALRRATVHVVSPSRWLAGVAAASPVFAGQPVEVIPNGVDTDRFTPGADRAQAKQDAALVPSSHHVLFGAQGAGTDPRKGFSALVGALRLLSRQIRDPPLEILAFGTQDAMKVGGVLIRGLGEVPADRLVSLYQAADVFVAPSLQENLATTVLESMACGTPVVAFDVGGMPDMIDHRVTGYLARPQDLEDLARGIVWVLDEASRGPRLRDAARRAVEARFTLARTANSYRQLYGRVLDRQTPQAVRKG